MLLKPLDLRLSQPHNGPCSPRWWMVVVSINAPPPLPKVDSCDAEVVGGSQLCRLMLGEHGIFPPPKKNKEPIIDMCPSRKKHPQHSTQSPFPPHTPLHPEPMPKNAHTLPTQQHFTNSGFSLARTLVRFSRPTCQVNPTRDCLYGSNGS